MKNILIIEDRQDALEKIDRWLSFNYPALENCSIIKSSNLSEVTSKMIGENDIIIFTGTVGGETLGGKLGLLQSWKNRLFIYQDEELSTRNFLVKLKKARIQTLKLVNHV